MVASDRGECGLPHCTNKKLAEALRYPVDPSSRAIKHIERLLFGWGKPPPLCSCGKTRTIQASIIGSAGAWNHEQGLTMTKSNSRELKCLTAVDRVRQSEVIAIKRTILETRSGMGQSQQKKKKKQEKKCVGMREPRTASNPMLREGAIVLSRSLRIFGAETERRERKARMVLTVEGAWEGA